MSYTYLAVSGADSQRNERTLRYARIDGEEYGLPLEVPVASEETAAPGALTLAIGPNPVIALARVRYTLPSTGTARLALYDVLGREVVRVVEGSARRVRMRRRST